MSNIFSKLFSNRKIHPSIANIYNKLAPDYRDKIIYGDLIEFNKQLLNMTREVFGEVNDENINSCFRIYLDVFIRSRGGLSPEFSRPQYIVERLCEKYSFFSEKVVTYCVWLSLEYIYIKEPELKEKVQLFEPMQDMVLENANKNQHLFNLYLRDIDYGLVPEKPVFVSGFTGAKEYLSHIVNCDDLSPDIVRVCSMNIKEISGPVDEYELSFGKYKQSIYVCNYGFKNSSVAPSGLKIKV